MSYTKPITPAILGIIALGIAAFGFYEGYTHRYSKKICTGWTAVAAVFGAITIILLCCALAIAPRPNENDTSDPPSLANNFE